MSVEIGGDGSEYAFGVGDQVHLVNGKDDVADAHQARDRRMPPGLREEALAGIDEQHRDVADGGPRRHVAGELLVARAVGDDEASPAGREIAVGHVDRDALLAFSGEAIEQQRIVEAVAARAGDRRKLVIRHQPGIDHHPPEQGRLPIVDGPASKHAQHVLFGHRAPQIDHALMHVS